MTQELIAVCSPKPRPTVQRNGKGSQWWTRDVYHLLTPPGLITMCGRDASEWLMIGPVEISDDCCKRCAALLRASAAQGVGQ